MAALVLVLLTSSRVYHDSAGNGDGVRYSELLLAEADIWIQADGVFDFRNCGIGIHRLGPPHVRVGDEPIPWHDVYGFDDDDCLAECSEDIQLVRHALGRQDSVHNANAFRFVVRLDVCYRWIVWHIYGCDTC